MRVTRRFRADRVPAERPDRPGSPEVGGLAARIVEGNTDWRHQHRLVRRFATAVTESARRAGIKGMASGAWPAETFLTEIAPRVPIRDHRTLRAHYGLAGEELADAVVRNAARGTATVGAAGGALATAQFTAPPLLLTAPAQLTAETLLVAAIEVKLIAELHEIYGAAPEGTPLRRVSTYCLSWARRRGVDPVEVAESATVALHATAKSALRHRLTRVLGRHLTTLGPYLAGAVAGATLNRSGTQNLGRQLRAELRAREGALAD